MQTDASWSGSMPATYDRLLGPALFAPFASELAGRAAALSPRDVLEVAAGTGIVTAELVRALPEALVTATDLNPAMVAWAAQQVPGPAWQTADAQHLALPDRAFDLAVCSFGVMFFPDRVAAYAEVARVLRPTGTLLVTVWDTVDGSTFAAALVDSLHAVLPDDPPTFLVRVPYGYADRDQIAADLTSAGLTVAGFQRLVLTGHAASAEAVAVGFCQGTPLRFELEERGDLGALTRAVAAQVTSRLGRGRVSGDLAAFLVTAQVRR